MTAPGYHVFDPLQGEYAAPFPAVLPMTQASSEALLHPAEPSAVLHARQLIGPARPWLTIQPASETLVKGVA